MGLEVFMPLILMIISEVYKIISRRYGIEPDPRLTPGVAVGAGVGLMSLPTFHTLPVKDWWFWVAFGIICGCAAVGMHQIPRVMGWTKSKRTRRATDRH